MLTEHDSIIFEDDASGFHFRAGLKEIGEQSAEGFGGKLAAILFHASRKIARKDMMGRETVAREIAGVMGKDGKAFLQSVVRAIDEIEKQDVA